MATIRQIVLDTETTGLDVKNNHRLIEVGAVELINRRLTGKNFHTYLNPERAVDPGALAVHGLNDTFLADKPTFQTVFSELLAYIEGAEVIIHNASFDLTFIEHELKLVNAKVKKLTQICQITDTLLMARKMHPGQKNSLDALCKRYQIDNTQRSMHGALLDAQLLARVYLSMTGGQSSLWGEESVPDAVPITPLGSSSTESMCVGDDQYLVLPPDAIELAAHDACLEMIQAKSKGQCLWLEMMET